MGEYGKIRATGERVKLGTCEDMLYLREDQTRLIAESDVDFTDRDILEVIRFRFPWPDEDGKEPGSFEPFRSLTLWGATVPAEVEHGLTQFTANYPKNGYLVSLPCPEGPDADSRVHKNGYGGPCKLTAQAWRGGRLVGIAECGGCGHAYRLTDGYELEAALSILEQAKRGDPGGRLEEIARRLRAGYERSLTDA